MKLNKKALLSLLVIVIGSLIIIHDFIKLLSGYSYTILGLVSVFMILALMSECYEYLKERGDNKWLK